MSNDIDKQYKHKDSDLLKECLSIMRHNSSKPTRNPASKSVTRRAIEDILELTRLQQEDIANG